MRSCPTLDRMTPIIHKTLASIIEWVNCLGEYAAFYPRDCITWEPFAQPFVVEMSH